jgi:hypothetical protein
VRSPRQAAARLRDLLGDDGGWPGARRWTAALGRLAEGQQHTLGAFSRPWQ